MKQRLPFRLANIMMLVLMADYAFAEPLGGFLPGATLPEQVGRYISSEQQKRQQTRVLPPIAQKKEEASPLGEQAKKIKFQLNGIVVEGNHVYTTRMLKPIWEKSLHKTISVADLFEIVQGITNTYRNNGYILSRAVLPPQHVKNGVVHVKVIEGFIGKVDVTGKPKGAYCQIMAFGKRIKECPPLQLSRMEKYLLLANEIPGAQVRAVLTPSKTDVGAADLSLVSQLQSVTGYFSYDNYGTRYIGPQQMTGNLGFNSFATSGDSTQFTMTKTPKGGELTYIDVNYNMPWDDNGVRVLVGGTRVHTHPLYVLRPAQIDGLNDNYYSTIYYPIIRTRSQSLTLRSGFNWLDSNVTSFSQELYTDHLRSIDLGGTFNFADSWNGSNLLSADFRQGLPLFGYTSNYNPQTAQTSRPGGRGDYTKVAATISRLQALRGPFSLYGIFQGQASCNPLLASEQFTFGGSQIGRGYDVAELIGDQGVAGSIEAHYDRSIAKFYLQSIQLYAFYDAGMTWNYKFIGNVPRKISATSAGVGMRFWGTSYITGNVFWAQPLTKEVAAMQFIGRGKDPRVFFSVVANLQ